MTTQMYGVIGWPVGHSASPAMMNSAFAQMGIDAYYAAFPVQPSRIEDAMKGLAALGVQGVNVTIPHKQAVMSFADSLTDEARLAGAVNTLRRRHDGDGWDAHNTDVVGWWQSIQASVNPTARRMAVLGAGGAARGILVAVSLYAPHLELTLVARRPEQRLLFERDFGSMLNLRTASWDSRHEVVGESDIVVNTTPIGMWPSQGESPLADASCLRPGQTVQDIVYRPLKTRLLADAESRGAVTVDGLWMLVYQGVAAVQFWQGRIPSADTMRRAALKFLGV